jgi:hypothetical protein
MCKSVKSLAKGAVIPCIEAIGRDAVRVPSAAVGTDDPSTAAAAAEPEIWRSADGPKRSRHPAAPSLTRSGRRLVVSQAI